MRSIIFVVKGDIKTERFLPLHSLTAPQKFCGAVFSVFCILRNQSVVTVLHFAVF